MRWSARSTRTHPTWTSIPAVPGSRRPVRKDQWRSGTWRADPRIRAGGAVGRRDRCRLQSRRIARRHSERRWHGSAVRGGHGRTAARSARLRMRRRGRELQPGRHEARLHELVRRCSDLGPRHRRPRRDRPSGRSRGRSPTRSAASTFTWISARRCRGTAGSTTGRAGSSFRSQSPTPASIWARSDTPAPLKLRARSTWAACCGERRRGGGAVLVVVAGDGSLHTQSHRPLSSTPPSEIREPAHPTGGGALSKPRKTRYVVLMKTNAREPRAGCSGGAARIGGRRRALLLIFDHRGDKRLSSISVSLHR